MSGWAAGAAEKGAFNQEVGGEGQINQSRSIARGVRDETSDDLTRIMPLREDGDGEGGRDGCHKLCADHLQRPVIRRGGTPIQRLGQKIL